MLSARVKDEAKPELETRPAYQFYSQIQSIIAPGEQATKKRSIFNDIYPSARKKLSVLKNQLNEFIKVIVQEENTREQYTVPDLLYKKNLSAKKELEKAREKYNQVNLNNDAEKSRLMTNEAFIASNLQVAENKLMVMKAEKFEEDKKRCDALLAQINNLHIKQNNLETAIDKKHPGCFPWRVRKERAELLALQAELKTTNEQITDLKERKQSYDDQEGAIINLRKQLSGAREAIIKHIAEYPLIIKAAREDIDQAEIKYKQTDIEIQKHKSRYYSSVSENVMKQVLVLQKSFLEYKAEIDLLYGSKSTIPLTDVAANLSSAKDRLDELMKQLWCEAKSNQNANVLYLEQNNSVLPERKL